VKSEHNHLLRISTDEKKLIFLDFTPQVRKLGYSSVIEYDAMTDTWTMKANMPTARSWLSSSVVNGKIYAIGGTLAYNDTPISTVEAYDPVSNTWTRKADMPTPRVCLSTSVVNGKIYAFGGTPSQPWYRGLFAVEEYNPATNTWTKKANMPTGRTFFSTSVVNGRIYAIGGLTTDYNHLSPVEEYNPATDTWIRKADMPTARSALSTSEVNGKIYAIVGWLGSDTAISTVEEYDPHSLVVDFDGDGIVDGADMCIMVDYWGTDESLCDIGPTPLGDGIVDVQDLILLSEHLFEEILPSGCVASWRLNDTEGNIAHNSTDYNDGICHGEPLWQPADGKIGGALQFDGINDYVETDLVLNPADGAFSVFTWIKGGALGQVMISQTDGDGTGQIWLGMDPSDGKLMTGLEPVMVTESIITDGQWHHVGIVVAAYQSMRYRSLYFDGVRVAMDTQSVELTSSNGGMYFGTDKTLDAGTFFSGLIDDVRIYDVALSAEEIATLAQ